MPTQIRPAVRKDVPALIGLCAAHAQFEESAYDATGKAERLSKALFGSEDILRCFVVEKEGKVLGYATCMKQYATWDAAYYVYLDCIYLDATLRGSGCGRQLMEVVYAYAKAEKCTQIQWQTPDFNEKAIQFYKHLGATHKSKERFFWAVV